MSKKKKKEKRKARSTAAAAKRRAETHKTGFDNTAITIPEDKKQFILKNDKSVRLDIIPYEVGEGNPFADKGELHYERTFWIHRGIGVDSTPFVCPRKTNDEPCPICEFRAKLMKDSDADEDLIKDLAPKERQLFNVIDTKDKTKGVQVWEISFHLFGKRLDTEIKNSDEDDNYENFAELEGGFTLKCGVEERSFGSQSFFEVSSIGFKPRSEDYDEDILEETTCLDDILIIKEYDELKEIFLQTVEDDDNDDDKKSSKKKSKKSKKDNEKSSKKSSKKDDDDDDDDVEDDDDDADDDADDDDDDAEEEEGEKEFDWEKGNRVIVTIDGEDYPGKIISVDEDEETVNVKCDDGDTVEDITSDNLKVEPEKKSKKGKDKKDKKGKDKNKKDKKGKGKCPGGGTFGKDTDELPACNDCPKWDECDDA